MGTPGFSVSRRNAPCTSTTPPFVFLVMRASERTYSCAEDALALLERGHFVQRLLTQAEFAGEKGRQGQVSRLWILSGHGEAVEIAG